MGRGGRERPLSLLLLRRRYTTERERKKGLSSPRVPQSAIERPSVSQGHTRERKDFLLSTSSYSSFPEQRRKKKVLNCRERERWSLAADQGMEEERD